LERGGGGGKKAVRIIAVLGVFWGWVAKVFAKGAMRVWVFFVGQAKKRGLVFFWGAKKKGVWFVWAGQRGGGRVFFVFGARKARGVCWIEKKHAYTRGWMEWPTWGRTGGRKKTKNKSFPGSN